MTTSYVGHQCQVNEIDISTDVECRINIKKRHQQVVYRTTTIQDRINLAYAMGEESSPSNNLSISDRSTSLIQNRMLSDGDLTTDIVGSFYINVESFLVTDTFTTDTPTQEAAPLFYVHTLKDFNPDIEDYSNKTLISVQFVDENLEIIQVSDYSINYTEGQVYNNIDNNYNSTTGEIDVVVLQYVVKDTTGGTTTTTTYYELVNNNTVYELADFSDLDEFGVLLPTVKRYLVEEALGGDDFLVTLPTVQTYAWKELSTSRIKIVPPDVYDTSLPWHLRVSNGKFITSLQSTTSSWDNYLYYIAEFNSQTYTPFPPYKRIDNQSAVWLNKRLLKVPRGVLFDESLGLTATIVAKNANGDIVAVYTNDSTKVGSYYSTTIQYSEGISCLDEEHGFIGMLIELDEDYEYITTYYIEEKEYEFTAIDFNPTNNLAILNQRIVLYLNPETSRTGDLDKTLYYLIVDPTGKILYCSQADENSTGLDWPTVKLLAEDFTAAGLPKHDFYYDILSTDEALSSRHSGVYLDSIPDFSFIDKYSVESALLDLTATSGILLYPKSENYAENPRFLILGEVSVGGHQNPDSLAIYDVRERGGGIKDDTTTEANSLTTQGEVSWYWDIGIQKPYPGAGTFYIEVPKSLYTSHGGELTQAQIRTAVEKHMKTGGYPIIRPYGIDPVIIDTTSASGQIGFTWPSYGAGQQYNVYFSIDNMAFLTMSGSPYTDVGGLNTLTIPGLRVSTTYYVYIAGINSDGYDEAGPIVAIDTGK